MVPYEHCHSATMTSPSKAFLLYATCTDLESVFAMAHAHTGLLLDHNKALMFVVIPNTVRCIGNKEKDMNSPWNKNSLLSICEIGLK